MLNSLSLVVDEGLTPALGLSASNRAYPLATHLRGFLAHLVWGAAAALAAEATYRLTGTTPRQPEKARHPAQGRPEGEARPPRAPSTISVAHPMRSAA